MPAASASSTATPGVRLADAASLITRPTLVWRLATDAPGEQTVEVGYQTDGITWRADYSLTLDADDAAADVSSWVTLLNLSGARYADASLKLVAGDVQRVQPPQYGRDRRLEAAARIADDSDGRGHGFAEKSFFEYHLYTLGRRTTVEQNATKQIELFPAKPGVPVEKIYVYYGLPEARFWIYDNAFNADRTFGTEGNKKVDLYVRLKNAEAEGLGIPLPAGRVRVYKRDAADGNARVRRRGRDPTHAERRGRPSSSSAARSTSSASESRPNSRSTRPRGWATESFEIKLRNHKPTPVTVLVKENLYRWANWQITASSDQYEKQDVPHDPRPGHAPP